MALLTSELDRIKYELGWNTLNAGAAPYIGIAQIFEQVIQPYMRAGATTTSSTTVTASTTPTPTTLTLASVTGISVNDRLIVDVDARQESAVVENISGSTVTVLLSLAHTGTYPVTVEGGESIVRGLLKRLRDIQDKIAASSSSAGLKKVDEIEFFGGEGDSRDQFKALVEQQAYWRSELCRILFGVGSLRGLAAGGGSMAVY